jgi:hypothetical protein
VCPQPRTLRVPNGLECALNTGVCMPIPYGAWLKPERWCHQQRQHHTSTAPTSTAPHQHRTTSTVSALASASASASALPTPPHDAPSRHHKPHRRDHTMYRAHSSDGRVACWLLREAVVRVDAQKHEVAHPSATTGACRVVVGRRRASGFLHDVAQVVVVEGAQDCGTVQVRIIERGPCIVGVRVRECVWVCVSWRACAGG